MLFFPHVLWGIVNLGLYKLQHTENVLHAYVDLTVYAFPLRHVVCITCGMYLLHVQQCNTALTSVVYGHVNLKFIIRKHACFTCRRFFGFFSQLSHTGKHRPG